MTLERAAVAWIGAAAVVAAIGAAGSIVACTQAGHEHLPKPLVYQVHDDSTAVTCFVAENRRGLALHCLPDAAIGAR